MSPASVAVCAAIPGGVAMTIETRHVCPHVGSPVTAARPTRISAPAAVPRTLNQTF
jgi:hypothetical protein